MYFVHDQVEFPILSVLTASAEHSAICDDPRHITFSAFKSQTDAELSIYTLKDLTCSNAVRKYFSPYLAL